MEKRGNTELQHCHRCNITHDPDLHEQQEGPYWDSPAGITRRIRMISEQFTFKIVNGATKIYGETSGYKWLVWVTRADERVCFPAGTLIATQHGEIPIEDIQPNDLVFTRKGLKKACATTKNLYVGTTVTIEHEKGTLTATRDHPIWKVGQGWVDVFHIKIGDLLKTVNNETSQVSTLSQRTSTLIVYNLEVEDEPEYFANGVLVHNCPICGPRHLKRWRITAFTPRIPAHLNCRCVFQLEGPELPPPGEPKVPRITQVIRGKQPKLIAKRDDWATDINIASKRRLFIIFFTADDERTRMIRWDELEMALLMRGFEEVEVHPRTISDEIFWQTLGFQRIGKGQFVKRLR